jgi:hypothetical protein
MRQQRQSRKQGGGGWPWDYLTPNSAKQKKSVELKTKLVGLQEEEAKVKSELEQAEKAEASAPVTPSATGTNGVAPVTNGSVPGTNTNANGVAPVTNTTVVNGVAPATPPKKFLGIFGGKKTKSKSKRGGTKSKKRSKGGKKSRSQKKR